MSSEEAAALSTAEYWNERYVNKDSHEWLRSYFALTPFFEKHLFAARPFNSRILHLGSGDSEIPVELAKYGYRDQLCVDFSSVIVNHMSALDAKRWGIYWMQADVRGMREIPDESVDVAFDKSTLDAMIHGSPWDPPNDV
jgi:EEF1A lysine methyltransferase 4